MRSGLHRGAYGRSVRVAAFQRQPILDDAHAVSAVVAEDVSWAASEGADLAIFPEAYLHGHSYDRETITARARALNDPEVRELTVCLRGFPVTVVVGMFERCESSVRNVALVLRGGAIVGVYAKARPNESGIEAGVGRSCPPPNCSHWTKPESARPHASTAVPRPVRMSPTPRT